MNISRNIFVTLVFFFAATAAIGEPTTIPPTSDKNAGTVQTKNPALSEIQRISLSQIGSQPIVVQLTFSPDSRWLAVYAHPEPGKTNILVFETETLKKVSTIHSDKDFGAGNLFALLWSMDNRTISFGGKFRWDALTGEQKTDAPIRGIHAQLNKDGTKLLTIEAATDIHFIHLYDTATWSETNIYAEHFFVGSAAWTAEDNIAIAVTPTPKTFGKTYNGHKISNIKDSGILLYSIKESKIISAKWFPPKRDETTEEEKWIRTGDVQLYISNFASNSILLSNNHILNGASLDYREFDPRKSPTDDMPGGGGYAFSADGNFLFIKKSRWYDDRHPVLNSIVNVATGELVSRFPGGENGIAASSDGHYLAMGDGDGFKLMKIN